MNTNNGLTYRDIQRIREREARKWRMVKIVAILIGIAALIAFALPDIVRLMQ
jgi:hypothetical protein